MSEKLKRPSIEELEKLLNGGPVPIQLMPNGSLQAVPEMSVDKIKEWLDCHTVSGVTCFDHVAIKYLLEQFAEAEAENKKLKSGIVMSLSQLSNGWQSASNDAGTKILRDLLKDTNP